MPVSNGTALRGPARPTTRAWWHWWAGRAALLVGAQRSAERHTRAWLLLNGQATAAQSATAMLTLAYLLAAKGSPEASAEAVDYLERAALLQPHLAVAWFNLGYLQQQAGQHVEGVKAFRQALALSPGMDRAWYGLGLSLMEMGRPTEALEAFQTTTRLQPHSPHGWAGCARAQMQLGDVESAQATLEHLRQFEPRAAQALQRDLQAEPSHPSLPTPQSGGAT